MNNGEIFWTQLNIQVMGFELFRFGDGNGFEYILLVPDPNTRLNMLYIYLY